MKPNNIFPPCWKIKRKGGVGEECIWDARAWQTTQFDKNLIKNQMKKYITVFTLNRRLI